MNFGQQVGDFLRNPFDPNNDGKTSALEWFAFLGLIGVLTFAWNVILARMFGRGAG